MLIVPTTPIPNWGAFPQVHCRMLNLALHLCTHQDVPPASQLSEDDVGIHADDVQQASKDHKAHVHAQYRTPAESGGFHLMISRHLNMSSMRRSPEVKI